MSSRPAIPRATYRLQLTPAFDFDAAAAVAGYLAGLGVSHVYCSPYLQAAPGSTHGYDVVDHSRVNAELGGDAGHRRLVAALRAAGLGQVLDIVPNHMAIAGRLNSWWWDVLENGPSSLWASYFDIAWDPPERRLQNRVLMPVLGDHYGRVLERGELRVERREGRLCLRYFDHEFPLAPASLAGLLGSAAGRSGSGELAALAVTAAALPDLRPGQRAEAAARHRAKEALAERLQALWERDAAAGAALDAEVEALGRDPDRLDALLDAQNYRLARWRAGDQDLDYRRFFDIDTLVGVRVEDDPVFEDTHRLVLGWLREGILDGLRIDHPDGLRDPLGYLERLASAAPGRWIVVEKILEPGESLPAAWPVAGTTGYDFANRVTGLLVDPAGEVPLTRLAEAFADGPLDFRELARQCRLEVLDGILAADLRRLTATFVNVCERNRAFRDFTRAELRETLRETMACFPVYRTYVRPERGEQSDADRRYVRQATAEAAARRPDLDPELFEFLAAVLLLEHPGVVEAELVSRFQQTTGPVMAKGVEDTALYRYPRLLCLNEVGGDPGRFGCGLDDFHAACAEAARSWPASMTTLSTHDTKRSEDVRARIALLSEIPGRWEAAVREWMAINERHRTAGAPDRLTEYLLYQVLYGAHPLPVERARAYMEKAVREARLRTSWTDPDPAYEAALRTFVEGALGDPAFTASLEAFAASLRDAGWTAALAQKLIQLTAPGVPDVYQGSELWDLSLVDPDNRRPVDYAARRALLGELETMTAAEAWARRDGGHPKLLVVRAALRARAEEPGAFAGDHVRLGARGGRANHLVAFARGGRAVTLAPRLVAGLAGDWLDTTVELPPGSWLDRFTGREWAGGETPVRDLLESFPVGLLIAR